MQASVCSYLKRDGTCISEFWDWFVAYKSPLQTFQEEPAFLLCQISVLLGAALNYLHARRLGGKYYHFWWACIVVALVVECVSYWLPTINNFWHAQGVITLVGKRFPLHIVFVYNQFWYPAFVAVERANLKWWAQPFATGLLAVFMDIPFDILGIKLLWWTWHDTDVNILDRHYDVPWTSYYFHSSFSAALVMIFSLRYLLSRPDKHTFGVCLLEWLCTLAAGLFAMPLGTLFFMALYSPLHDRYGVHSEVPVMVWLFFLAWITWSSDRYPSASARAHIKLYDRRPWLDEVLLNVYLHYIFYGLLVLYVSPQDVVSTGLHQMTGPCNATEESFSQTGTPLTRLKYLCTTDYNEPMDWHCLPEGKPPADGLEWYTVCGTRFSNPLEYKTVIWALCLLGFSIFVQFLVFSGVQLTEHKSKTLDVKKAQKDTQRVKGKAKQQ